MITLTHQEMLERFPIKYNIDFTKHQVIESFSGTWDCPIEVANLFVSQNISTSTIQNLAKVILKAPKFFGKRDYIYDNLWDFFKQQNERKIELVKLDSNKTYKFDIAFLPEPQDKLYVAVTQWNSLPVGVHELNSTARICGFGDYMIEVIVESKDGERYKLDVNKDGSLSISRTYWYVFKTKEQACDFLKKELQSQMTKQQELINSL